MTPVVSVVLGTYQRFEFLKLTIESVRAELHNTPHEIIVVDGGSTDGSLEWLVQQKDVMTIVQHNRGEWNGKEIERRSWGYFMNLGFRAAAAKFTCMLSDDCLLVPGAIVNGIRRFEQRLSEGINLGAVAFYWRNWPDQETYNVGITLGGKMFVNHGLYLRKALQAVGYIDEENFSFYHADGDLCLKLWQAGYTCEDSPNSFVEHYTHANLKVRASNLELQQQDWSMYLEKWRGIFFNPSDAETGSWKLRAFDDPANTGRGFRPLHKRQPVKAVRDLSKSLLGAVGLLNSATRMVRRIRGVRA